MSETTHKFAGHGLATAAAMGIAAATVFPGISARASAEVDWSAVPAATVTLFYPGQGGYLSLIHI